MFAKIMALHFGHLTCACPLSSMSFLPDIILVCGLAVVALALCIFLLWLGIWLLVEGIRLTIGLISGAYGKVLRKGGADNE